jgi:quercetin dioxygenase-like cupin family protein
MAIASGLHGSWLWQSQLASINLGCQSLFDAKEPSRSSGGQVTFQAGARSAWHTHPLGQVLIVTEGVGWIQQWGGVGSGDP